MTIDTSFGALANAGTGLLVAALGVWTATRKPRRPANLAFGLFATAWGLALVPSNLHTLDGAISTALIAAKMVLWPLVALGLVALAYTFPTRPRDEHRQTVHAAVAVGAGAVIVGWISYAATAYSRVYELALADGLSATEARVVALSPFTEVPYVVALPILLVIWAARASHWSGADEDASARAAALVGAGLAPFIGLLIASGMFDVQALGLGGLLLLIGGLGAMALGAWAVVGLHGRTSVRPWAWTVVGLLFLGFVAEFLIIRIGGTGALSLADRGPQWAVSRVLGVSILAYAIVRHQLFDIDVKVKWTLKQSTVAAIFIAVFFVVSEGAAALFEAQTGSTWAGIIAAGALVFAIAPLQRFAEKVSDRAMPHVEDTPDYHARRAREIYEAAVASSLEDGIITEGERDVMATLAQELGLGPVDARAIEREVVEDEGGAS